MTRNSKVDLLRQVLCVFIAAKICTKVSNKGTAKFLVGFNRFASGLLMIQVTCDMSRYLLVRDCQLIIPRMARTSTALGCFYTVVYGSTIHHCLVSMQ